jgi:YegS/Rv2252/BmrU family lipid kinase
MDRMLVITNAAAGMVDDDAIHDALEVLTRHGDVVTAATDDLEELTGALRERDGRDVVVVGGDGSLHAAVSVLHELGQLAGTTLGLVPLGTGNDFARTLDLPDRPDQAARVITEGVPRALDLIVDDRGRVIVNAAHLGVGVDAGREARRWKAKLGALGYVVGALTAGIRSDGIRVRVEADGMVVADGRTRVLQVAIANGSYIGGGTPIAPDAVPDDGLAEVIVSFAVSALPRAVYGLLLRLGRHQADDRVTTTRATRVTVSGAAFGTNTDGELDGPVPQRTWTVDPGAYRIMTPVNGFQILPGPSETSGRQDRRTRG